jgi:hypothetical protein
MSKDKQVDPSLADTLKVSSGILVYFSLLVITEASKKIKHWDIPYASFTRSPLQDQSFSWHSLMLQWQMMINWRVHCYLGLLRIVTVTSKETTSHTQIRVQ